MKRHLDYIPSCHHTRNIKIQFNTIFSVPSLAHKVYTPHQKFLRCTLTHLVSIKRMLSEAKQSKADFCSKRQTVSCFREAMCSVECVVAQFCDVKLQCAAEWWWMMSFYIVLGSSRRYQLRLCTEGILRIVLSSLQHKRSSVKSNIRMF